MSSVTTPSAHGMTVHTPKGVKMATATENRKRKRRTFTMDDESYERLTHMADSAHTNRSRFLEQLILLAEPIFSWETPPPRPWWKFWGQVPQPPELVAPAHNRQIIG